MGWIGFGGKGNSRWSTGEGVFVYGESFEGYRWKEHWLWVKGYGGIRWKGLKRRLFALKRHLFSLKRHLFEAKRRLFNCFHPRQTFLSPNANTPFTYWRRILHRWHPRLGIGKRQSAAQVPEWKGVTHPPHKYVAKLKIIIREISVLYCFFETGFDILWTVFSQAVSSLRIRPANALKRGFVINSEFY